VKRVPAPHGLRDQAGPGELGEQPLYLLRWQAREAAGRCGREVRARMQAKEAEQPGGPVAELADRPGEHGPDGSRWVANVEGIEAVVLAAHLGGE
jgi:hypothetical protein